MNILAIHGGMETPFEDLRTFDFGRIPHDAAAVLVKDGVVVAAIEEERLSRIKHTGKAPTHAMNFCLDSLGISFADIDALVMTTREQECDLLVREDFYYRESTYKNTREMLVDMISKAHGIKFDAKKYISSIIIHVMLQVRTLCLVSIAA